MISSEEKHFGGNISIELDRSNLGIEWERAHHPSFLQIVTSDRALIQDSSILFARCLRRESVPNSRNGCFQNVNYLLFQFDGVVKKEFLRSLEVSKLCSIQARDPYTDLYVVPRFPTFLFLSFALLLSIHSIFNGITSIIFPSSIFLVPD